MGYSEKGVLPTAEPQRSPHVLERRRKAFIFVFTVLLLRAVVLPYFNPAWAIVRISNKYDSDEYLAKQSTICEQADAIQPSIDVKSIVQGKDEWIREKLAGSVRIPTEIFDVMGPVGEDKRYDIFFKFAECERAIASSGPYSANGCRSRDLVPSCVSRVVGVELRSLT